MALLEWLVHGTIPVPGDGSSAPARSIGNLFGLASAILGMKRFVWAWPVGLVGNVLLFTVFATGELSGAHRRAPVGPGRSPGLLRRGVASTAGGAGRSCARPAVRPTAAPSRPAGRPARSGCQLARPGRRRLRSGVRPPHPGARLLGPDDRGLDPRRLDARDLRHGPRLGGVLAGLDPRRRRRRDHAGPGRLLPDGRHVPLLRRLRRHRLRRVAARRRTVVDTTHADAAPRRCRHERAA